MMETLVLILAGTFIILICRFIWDFVMLTTSFLSPSKLIAKEGDSNNG
ncbi:hypothetical protein ICR95_25660 (plasmid) [Priestia megaterium]|uniref:ATP synthase F0 subunit 8 n=1 Tax=Priestia megaterium TaxID=1404 RepID=A0AAX6BTA1_PRIMG|nr:hypothetical protein [Priestia megaterium]QSF35864.1 hypothetical protein ICR95_25660 [Priestia megaterium]GMG76955.1 hypothetical protein ShirakiTB12_54240 [Priestia megaterium]